MSMPTKLSTTGAAVLHAAADHPEGRATPPEILPAAARNAVMVSLLRAGLLEEVAPEGDGSPATFQITPAGLAAIGREPPARGDESGPSVSTAAITPQVARLPLRGAAEALLVAWDAGDDRPGLPSAVEALRAALARRGAGSRRSPQDRTAPRRPREGTKREAVLSLLRRPEGATIADLVAATGWAGHTVRGFLAGLKKASLNVTVLERVRQVGPGASGAKGSYSICCVAEVAPASANAVEVV